MGDELDLTFRDTEAIKNFKLDDENVATQTSRDQHTTEEAVEKCYDRFVQKLSMDPKVRKLNRSEHTKYLENMLHQLATNYECLDSSRPWMVYWDLQASHLLNLTYADTILDYIIQFLTRCRHKNGGFGGGPGQYPHLAPTYAAVNSLCIIGTKQAYDAIDRESLIKFLFSVKQEDGSFRMHVDGEIDVRGAYCAISVAKLVCVPLDIQEKLFEKTGEWIAKCQTYEGGFGGAPDLEAHGGYSFCGIAGLALLNETDKCDIDQLLRWSVQRQMPFEGGFQGRTNKLVDGCYSFWVGASIPIAQAVLANAGDGSEQCLFDSGALQEYILICCQKRNGGLIDKPGKPQDLYHTCYTLSGVAIAQHSESSSYAAVLGDPSNELVPTHPLFNVPPKAVTDCLRHFRLLNIANQDDSLNKDKSAPTEITTTESDETSNDQEEITEDISISSNNSY